MIVCGSMLVADPDRPLRRIGVGGRSTEFPPNNLTLVQAEEVLARELLEWMYVYDPAARQVARFKGTADEVDLSDELKSRKGALGLYGEPVLRDHLIVHNHPSTTGFDAVESCTPSAAAVSMIVECDVSTLVVVSGGIRYEVRRPGRHWPVDEEVIEQLLSDLDAELDETFERAMPTSRGSAQRQRQRLRRLGEMGVIEYEEYP